MAKDRLLTMDSHKRPEWYNKFVDTKTNRDKFQINQVGSFEGTSDKAKGQEWATDDTGYNHLCYHLEDAHAKAKCKLPLYIKGKVNSKIAWTISEGKYAVYVGQTA